jgi:tetratricopeptide (TPR) repeat protein
VAASVARASAGELLGSDPEAAHSALLAVSGQFAELGDLASAWEARATAAIGQTRAGDQEDAAEAAAVAIGEAETAYAAGTLTPRQYLAVRRARPLMAFDALAAQTDRSAADLAGTAELIRSELAMAEQLGEQRDAATFHELLAQLSSWQGDQDKFQAHLGAARALCLVAGQPWHAARPAAILGQVALQAGDPQAAEASAREALACGAGLLTKQETAQLSSLLAEAIGAQPSRDAELVEAFLTAASYWEGLSEPDTLHNTFNAARTYARLGRPGEAAALFAEVMPRVDIPYEPAVVALTREQFGSSLGELDRHREASEQFLRAATLLQDDPRHAAAHARLAASAAESLQRSGQLAEALAAFQRAATLFRELGDDVRWARCRRSAAWLQFWDPPAPPAGPDAEPAGVTAMRAVLSDLESMTAVDPSEELVAELAATSKQLTKMLTEPDPDDEDEDDDEDE